MSPRGHVLGLLAILSSLLGASPALAASDTWQRPDASPLHDILAQLFPGEQFGKSYALVIGVGDYDSFEKLDAPARDAIRVRNFLKQAGFDYIVTLTDADANKDRIERLMDTDFPRIVGKNDRFLFYFSGHGATRSVVTEGGARGYLILKSSHPGRWDEMIGMPEVHDWAENLGNVRHVLFVLDACFSGLAAYQAKGAADTRDATISRLSEPSSYLLTAGVDKQESYTYNGTSLFTEAFLSAARGVDAPSDGIISLDDMISRIDRFIDAKRAELGPAIDMTPHLYQERTENNEGEFFFIAKNSPRLVARAEGTAAPGNIQSKSGNIGGQQQEQPALEKTAFGLAREARDAADKGDCDSAGRLLAAARQVAQQAGSAQAPGPYGESITMTLQDLENSVRQCHPQAKAVATPAGSLLCLLSQTHTPRLVNSLEECRNLGGVLYK